jgi:predicted enzyme related to lactoylglutathione lyase
MMTHLRAAAATALLALTTGCAPSVSVPPVTPSPTGSFHPGKVVWYDLLAHDLPSVERFYGELFGWDFDDRGEADPSYVVVRSDGRAIAGVARIDRLKGDVAGAQWISWISVPDVDRAAAAAIAGGGAILRTPRDLELRGRAAVIADPEGAPIALLRSASGDPADAEAALNEWIWTELWTWDARGAQAFYRDVVGYEGGTLDEPGLGADYAVFRMGDVPRAGIIQLETDGVRSHWVPYVRVADPHAVVERVDDLGGRVLIPPSDELRSGSVALIADPGGAPLVVQQWPIPGQEGGR